MWKLIPSSWADWVPRRKWTRRGIWVGGLPRWGSCCEEMWGGRKKNHILCPCEERLSGEGEAILWLLLHRHFALQRTALGAFRPRSYTRFLPCLVHHFAWVMVWMFPLSSYFGNFIPNVAPELFPCKWITLSIARVDWLWKEHGPPHASFILSSTFCHGMT